MPHFFFDLTSGGVVTLDDIGTDYPSLEEAYLETCRAALDMSFEKFRSRDDPRDDSFDILDEQRRALMHVPFSDVLQPRTRPNPVSATPTIEACRRHRARNDALRADVRSELKKMESAVDTMLTSMARLKAIPL